MPYASRNGVRIWYEVEGRGTPLALHIGFMGSSDDWRGEGAGYTDALRDAYQLILIDPRGHGKSDKPHDPESYTLAVRARDAIAVLVDLGIGRAHFRGYSTGGYVGFTLGIRAPERLISLVIGGANPYRHVEDPTQLGMYLWLAGGIEGFIEEWERAIGPAPDALKMRWREEDAEALRMALLAPRPAGDITDALPGIAVPSLLYAGSGDSPEPVRDAAGAMPDATFVELEGLSHVGAFQRSDAVLAHVRPFLDRHTPVSGTDS